MAATYLLDTNVCSDFMPEHRKVSARLTELLPSGRLCVCSIVRGEIFYGLERMVEGRLRQEFTRKAHNLFSALSCEPIGEAAADHYGRVKRRAETKALPLDENDLWIAATAIAIDAVLVTRDRAFRRLTGLIVEDWTK